MEEIKINIPNNETHRPSESNTDWREAKNDGGVVDHYFVGGKEWEMSWKKTEKIIPDKLKEQIKKLINPWRTEWHWEDKSDATKEKRDKKWEKEAKTHIELPCAGKDCLGKTWWTVHDLKIAEEKNFEHELCEEFFCAKCRGVGVGSRLERKWEEICPAQFKGAGVSKVELFPQAWQLVANWAKNLHSNEKKSLYLYGGSGRCKSRMLFQLLKDYIVPSGLDFKVYFKGDFRYENEDRRFWLGHRVEAEQIDVLAFDDFGQTALMESQMADLSALIDKRYREGKTTIFLSNRSLQGLDKVFGVGPQSSAIRRRIYEMATTIYVDEKYSEKGYQRSVVEDFGAGESPFGEGLKWTSKD